MEKEKQLALPAHVRQASVAQESDIDLEEFKDAIDDPAAFAELFGAAAADPDRPSAGGDDFSRGGSNPRSQASFKMRPSDGIQDMFADLEKRKESVKQAGASDENSHLAPLELPENFAITSNVSLSAHGGEENKSSGVSLKNGAGAGIIDFNEQAKRSSKGPFQPASLPEELVEAIARQTTSRTQESAEPAPDIDVISPSSEPTQQESKISEDEEPQSPVAKGHLSASLKRQDTGSFSVKGSSILLDKDLFTSCPGRLAALGGGEEAKHSSQRQLPSSFAFTGRKGNFVKIKTNKKSEVEFRGLYLAQTLFTKPGSHIRVMRFNFTGEFLAAGTDQGYLWVWRLSDENDEEQDYTKLIERNHHIKAQLHDKGILDLSWSSAVSTKILTCGLDRKVVLFDIKTGHLTEFPHKREVTSVDFLNDSDEFFISGTIHGYVRLWNVGQKKPVDYHVLDNEAAVHTARFTPDNRQILVGSEKGLLIVLNHENNRTGATKNGRKLTGLHFLSNSLFLATTADDRIRLFDLEVGWLVQLAQSVEKQLGKYKGHVHKNLLLTATASDDQRYVICPSENGKVFIWNFKREGYIPAVNPKQVPLSITFRWTGQKLTTNSQYESFAPLGIKHLTCAAIAPCQVSQIAMKKILSFAAQDTPLVDRVVLAAGRDGSIEVYFRESPTP